MKLSRASIAVLIIQLAIVSSIAAKYLYQRWTCPRVWARAVAYDPEMLMRGRYLSAQIHVNACDISLPPLANYATARPSQIVLFDKHGIQLPYLNAKIGVRSGKLAVLKLSEEADADTNQQRIEKRVGSECSEAFLQQPIDFYLSETAKSPFPLRDGQQLWVEVTVPPAGPPRPLGLAIKGSDGQWQPLSYR